MIKWFKGLFQRETVKVLSTLEEMERAVDNLNYWWAKLEEEGNPDRIAPWMLWGKNRQVVLSARRIGHEEVYHSPVIPAPAYAKHFDSRGYTK